MYKKLNICDLTPRQDIEYRIKQLQNEMVRQGIAFTVILHNVGLFYFTGSLQRGVLVIRAEGDPIYLVEKNVKRALIETPLEVIAISNNKQVKDILLGKMHLQGICGMELDVLPVLVFEKWKALLGLGKVVDISTAIKQLRMIKSQFELEQIQHSGKIVSRVFEKAGEIIHEGVKEVDLAAALEAEGRRHGHQGFLRMRGLNQEMLNIYITHGYSGTVFSNCDVPISGFGVTHAIAQGPSIQLLERDIPILIDYGGGYNGYITDETRVYVIGHMKEIFYKAYLVARDIIEDAAGFGREGVDTTEIYGRALQLAKRAGLEDHFMGYGPGKVSFIGHGIGLEINEWPVITAGHHTVLREGMVFAYEPKFIFPEAGAVGIEVDFIVKKDRLERVTDSSIDICIVNHL
jgi:Xaa-Pro aminopeptidase